MKESQDNPDNWIIWPELLLPAIVVGLILCIRIWNAKVQPKKKEEDNKPADDANADADAEKSEDAEKSPADASDDAKPAAEA